MTPSRLVRYIPWVIIAAGLVSSQVANIFTAVLLSENPIWLMILNPAPAQIVLVTPLLDPWLIYAAALPRRMIGGFAYYLVGRMYGERALNWMRSRNEAFDWLAAQLEQRKWLAPAALLFINSSVVDVIGGAFKVSPWVYIGLKLVNNLMIITISRTTGQVFEQPVMGAIGFIRDNALWITIVLALYTLGSWYLQFRKKKDQSPPTD